MLSKTRGIVLHSIPYSDRYGIVHVYTEAFGRTAYMVARRGGRKSATPQAFFMPLSVLEMDVEHLNGRDIQRIREVKTGCPLHSIFTHPVKNCIALFLAEVLYRAVRTREADPHLFNYLFDSIRWLEMAEQGVANFHLVFLMHLVRYLGVYPNVESYGPDCFFDLLNGAFSASPPGHRHFLDRRESVIFARLLRMNYANMGLYAFARGERYGIVCRILEYYSLHLSDFQEIRSLDVMRSLFE
jgi:DNA repair protein RecO (recombination protein O)